MNLNGISLVFDDLILLVTNKYESIKPSKSKCKSEEPKHPKAQRKLRLQDNKGGDRGDSIPFKGGVIGCVIVRFGGEAEEVGVGQ